MSPVLVSRARGTERKMILFESNSVRHVVGRLERGEWLMESLLALAREKNVTSGWVSGLGALEWVELCEYDQEGQGYQAARRFDTSCEILSLVGNLSFRDGEPFAHVHVTVSRDTDNGVEVLGGHLVDARVFACELRVECWDDLILGREEDAKTGLALWSGSSQSVPLRRASEPPTRLAPRVPEQPAEVEDSPEAPGGSVSWAAVAEASAEPTPAPARKPAPAKPRFSKEAPTLSAPVPRPLPDRRRVSDDSSLDDPVPERGDWIDHKVFGLCKVEKETDEGNLIIRLPSGRRKAINLDVMRVFAPRLDGERRIYPVRPRKK